MKKVIPMEKTNKRTKLWPVTGAIALAAVIGGVAYAQDFRTFAGSNERAGRSTLQPAVAVPETTWGNAGRGFLRWWDPIFETGNEVDNDDPDAGTSLGVFVDPANGDFTLAGGYLQLNIAQAPYRYAVTSTTGGNDGPNPQVGATAAFTWTLDNLGAGNEFDIEVNLPIGPTDIDTSINDDLRFTPAFQLYGVEDANGTRFFWVDMRAQAGGYAPLGDTSTAPFVARPALGGSVVVTLYNVHRRNDFGTLIDNTDQPGQDVVYADAVKAVGQSPSSAGTYVASPVVGELTEPRLDAQPTVFDQRVVSARNEPVFVGALNKEFRFGVLSSFTHNGQVVDAGEPLRRNMVWSWPAVRPFNLNQSETDRYAIERQNWISGGVNPAYPRNLIFRQSDNLSAGTSIGAGFVDDNTFNSVGPNYAIIPATAAPTSFVEWEPVANPGTYFIEVHLPNNHGPNDLARTVTYQILQGGAVVATRTISQASFNNWIRLPNQPDGFAHTVLNPLTVRVLSSGDGNDVANGRSVYADAIRFVGDADLGITSTPVQTVATVGGNVIDVILAARENGSIVAMEAHGDEVTGTAPNVLWTYPSQDPDADPNSALAEDGGIAEMPPGFGLSSALVSDATGPDVAYIGGLNGRVYALDMNGRGDGTTQRRWTWPADYDPSNPTTPMSLSGIGKIVGSVALANVAGTPAIIVATDAGRIFAIDAAGNGATRTTNILWQYPAAIDPPLGAMTTTPVVAFGRVYVGTENVDGPGIQGMVALDEDTGLLDWQRSERADNVTPFGRISGSPAAVEAPIVATNSLYMVDGGGFITSLNAATGAIQWQEFSVTSGSSTGVRFAYMRTFNPAGTFIDNAVPTVLVSSTQGALLGYYADGSLNINGNRRNWGYFLEGEDGQPQLASLAVGGWPNAAGLLANRTHIYAADAGGILYAFSSEDDFNAVPPLTPGIPPGSQSANPNDPDQTLLNDMIEQEDVVLLSPEDYEALEQAAQAGTVTYGDLTTYQANQIQRRNFEHGETLHILVKDIHATTVVETAGYSIQSGLVGNGTPSRRGTVSAVRDASGGPTPEESGYAFFKLPISPIGGGSATAGDLNVEVRAIQQRVRGDVQTLALPTVPPPFASSIRVALPLGLQFRDSGGVVLNQAGVTTDPANILVSQNLAPGYTGGATPFNKWTNAFVDPGAGLGVPGGRFSSRVNGSDPVSHNSTGVSAMEVVDRSLMVLLNRSTVGLTNVRVQANDMVWQPASNSVPTNAAQAGVYKPLPAAYAGFEDFPTSFPNISQDYPDMNRGGLQIAKSLGGDTENPLFGGVRLVPPTFTALDRSTYNTRLGYETGLGRALRPTIFSMRMAIPQYQPATQTGGTRPFGYVAENIVYVDSGEAGFSDSDSARRFTMAANVAPDENIVTTTRTVDLGSIPGGGGHYNSGTGNAVYPGQFNSFAPFNAGFLDPNAPQFQNVTGFNEGNVNLLNVRVSRRLAELVNPFNQVERPLELFAPAEHELAWFDAANTLFSDLDPALSPTNRAGIDPAGAIALQKPRPGDPAPTRLSTNPRRRQNSNLNVASGTLIANTTAFPAGDPFVGIAVPLGAPVGSYVRDIFLFEDTIAGSADYGANFPTLGFQVGASGLVPEAYTDPAISLKFNVRETRVTTRPTAKTRSIFENIPVADPGFDWSNRQPTIAVTDEGDKVIAFSSNRLGVGGSSIFARGKTAADGSVPSVWRIHFAGSTAGLTPFGPSQSPLAANLSRTVPTTTWIEPSTTLPAVNEWTNWFAVNAGESLTGPTDESSARFLYPTFSGHGAVDPLDVATPTRAAQARRFMAFVGETTKRDRTGNVVPLSQLMLVDLQISAGVPTRLPSGSLNGIYPLATDPTSKKGKPSIIQQGSNVAAFYPAQSSGRTEIYSAVFNGATWNGVQSLGVGATFEEVSGISASARRVPLGISASGTAVEMFFTGQVRGRQNSEAYMGQLPVAVNGMPVANQTWNIFEDRFDRLEYDATTGMYWAPGVDFAMGRADVDNFQLFLVDPRTGALSRLINNDSAVPADMRERLIDRETREMVFGSPRGGKVYVDARRGSVRLSGTVLGRNSQVFIAYSPKFIRVSGATTAFRTGSGLIATANASAGLNYRGASVVFDDRLLGVFDNGVPSRRLREDMNFWVNTFGTPIAPPSNPLPANLLRQDRFYAAFGRSSNDGSTAARPVMSSLRFGIHLPMPIAVNSDTSAVGLNITGLSGSGSNVVQLDPVGGKIYMQAEEEGTVVTVTYTGIDANGQFVFNQQVQARVGLIIEQGEQLVPIEQIGQEGDLSITMDRLETNNVSLTERRPPLIWMVWSSTRAGAQDIYMQTLAPKTTPRISRRP